jgi:SAM-dependent methyltransferase
MNSTKIEVDFDKQLKADSTGYNRTLTRWYDTRASNRSHCNAYREITKYIAAHICPHPFLTVDYGCGTGRLLVELALRFQKAKFIGVDGSSAMLDTLKAYLRKELPTLQDRIKLLHNALPSNLALGKKADLVTFTFPHILTSLYRLDLNSFLEFLTYSEIENAVNLAESIDDDTDKDELVNSLLVNRVISRNLRFLLRSGGHCIRVECANTRREEFPKTLQKRYLFEEGCLEKSLSDRKLNQYFQLVHSEYHRSKVMEDVYEQTKDETDRKGGYWISLLKAL